MHDLDFAPGDPAAYVVGKQEEKPARIHGRQRPKPQPTASMILADVRLRLQELEPLVSEYKRLQEAEAILRKHTK